MKLRIKKALLILVMGVLLSGCSSSDTRGPLNIQPVAFGIANGLIVIADDEIWNGPVGDSIRFYFNAPYLILPQPEPIFDIKHFTPVDLEKEGIRREFRHIIFVGNLTDDDSPTTHIIRKDIGVARVSEAIQNPSFSSLEGKNKWAKDQVVVYLFGKTEEALAKNVVSNFPAISKRFQNRDVHLIQADAYHAGTNTKLIEEVKAAMDVEMKIPSEYFLAINDGNVISLRKESSKVSINILLTRIPYKSESQFSKKYIKEIRDGLGKKYVSTRSDSTFMQTNDVDLPMFTITTTLNDNYCMEARGIWEIVNDFMGGPFISYLIHNKDKRELLYVEGFLHAPSQEKRNYMQQIEQILATVKY